MQVCLPTRLLVRGLALIAIACFVVNFESSSHGQEYSLQAPVALQRGMDVLPISQSSIGESADFNCDPANEPTSDDEAKNKQKRLAELKKKAATAHKPLFFDNDFSYLCNETYQDFSFGDGLKNRSLPRGGSYDIGGQNRVRFHSERNMRGLGLTGVDDKFLLRRTRVYGDFRLSPDIRVYAEMLDADSNHEDFGPRPIEVNRFEMQNLFVDARLLARGGNSLTARVGRQELLFGAQRNVSPLDWANTRRTFEGARLMLKQKDRTFDAFWTNPMRVDDDSFDSPDRDQEFMGMYSSYTGMANQTVDTYFLRYLNGRGANNFQFNTFGTRWQGSNGNNLWDVEGAYQYGDNTDGSSHVAGMLTMGVGRKLKGCWKPTLWAYYDWGVGRRCDRSRERFPPQLSVGSQIQWIHGFIWPTKSGRRQPSTCCSTERASKTDGLVSLLLPRNSDGHALLCCDDTFQRRKCPWQC